MTEKSNKTIEQLIENGEIRITTEYKKIRINGVLILNRIGHSEGVEVKKNKLNPFGVKNLDEGRKYGKSFVSEDLMIEVRRIEAEYDQLLKPSDQPDQPVHIGELKQIVSEQDNYFAVLPDNIYPALIQKHPGTLAVLMSLQKTHPDYIKQYEGPGKTTISYVAGSYMVRALNYAFLYNWNFSIVETREEDSEFVVLGRLEATTTDGIHIFREQFGQAEKMYSQIDSTEIMRGDRMKAAATDALKKCAASLGVAQDVYTGDV